MNRLKVRISLAGALLLASTLCVGCSQEIPEGAQSPITPEMERQAEASSNYMMEQMKTKKAQPK